MCSHVEGIEICNLVLSSGFILKIKKTFYIPGFSRNLISVPKLISFGYSFNFLDTSFNLYYKPDIVGNGILCDSLLSLNLQNDATYNAMYAQNGIKRYVVNKDSSIL